MEKEAGRGATQGLEPIGAGPGQSQGTGYMSKAPNLRAPASSARPGEKITVIDDSNEEWWRVSERLGLGWDVG